MLLVRVKNVKVVAVTVTVTIISKHGVKLVRQDAVRRTVSTPAINNVIQEARFVVQAAVLVRVVNTILLTPIFYESFKF